MAKQSGIGDNLYVDGYDLSGDVGAIDSIEQSQGLFDVTAIDKGAIERLGLQRDASMAFNYYFNDVAGQSHPVLKTVPSTDRIICYYRGTSLGGNVFALVGKQTDNSFNREQDGSLLGSFTAEKSNGGDDGWCVSMTAGKRTDTSATEGTGVDNAAASAAGLVAFLQAFSFSGTDVTVKIQESSDNGSGDAFADVTGGGFTQITTGGPPLAQRIATGAIAVERYLRAVTVTTGGFSSLVFAVAVRRG